MIEALQVLRDGAPAFAHGLANTVAVWVIACTAGTIMGAVAGVALYLLREKRSIYQFAAHVLPTLVRSVPILVLLVWVHYSLPEYGLVVPPFVTASIVLTLSVTVNATETIRGALEAIPLGEVESGYALGLRVPDVARHILLPLARRTAAPGLLLVYVDTLKLTTFASVIAFEELLHVTDTTIASTYHAMPAYTALALVFIVIVFPFEYLVRWYARSRAVIR
jgi:His/Glu/Gln/Arg/opine family amino acid ABC transporter permease subunit